MALDPFKVACWRFERIAPLLDHCLEEKQRCELIERMADEVVRWPSGRENPIGASTLYNWLQRYRVDSRIESLLPKPYIVPVRQPAIKRDWIDYALGLIEEQPQRSMFILCRRIKDKFGLVTAPSRSSLHRALQRQRRYVVAAVMRRERRRIRFQAAAVHQIWQADAKADFVVVFTDGARRRVRVLSILDDCSRFVVAALVVASESLPAVVRTFYDAVTRYGLPESFYADRGSAYDALLLRTALAVLGIRRINTRARNAPAHGKIEAYHRSLDNWFIKELPHQQIVDMTHLQRLLDAFIDKLYNDHRHREIGMTPRQAFNNIISRRTVSLDRLHRALLQTHRQKPDRKTGTVRAAGRLWRIPDKYLVPRCPLRIGESLLDDKCVFLIDQACNLIKLQPAVRMANAPHPSTSANDTLQYPAGSLSPLLEAYRGRMLPQARSGFGLPEIYQIFAQVVQRPVPHTEAEATSILQWLKAHGPFEPHAFKAALDATIKRLGPGRPLQQIIEELTRSIKNNQSAKGKRL